MATTGSKTVTIRSWLSLRLRWETLSQNTTNNTSTIKWYLELISGSGGKLTSSVLKNSQVVIDGKTFSQGVYVSIGANQTKRLASGNATIAHNEDGTKTFSYSFMVDFGTINLSDGSKIQKVSGSGTGTLERTRPEAPVITRMYDIFDSLGYFILEYEPRPDYDSLEIRFSTFATEKVIIPYREISKTDDTLVLYFTEEEKLAFRKQITLGNAQSFNVELKGVYKGYTYPITSMKTTYYLDGDNLQPEINVTYKDINPVTLAITGDENYIIGGHSIIQYSMTVTPNPGATITEAWVENHGVVVTNGTSGTFTDVGFQGYSFYAKDNRGYQGEWDGFIYTYAYYYKPTLEFEVTKPNAEDTKLYFNITGTYMPYYSFASTEFRDNTLKVQYRYKVNNGSYTSWATATPTITEGTDEGYNTVYAPPSPSTYEANLNIPFNYENSYSIQVKVQDSLNSLQDEQFISLKPVFDWSSSDFNFNVPIKINEVEMKDFVVEEGEQYGWYYRKWNSGVAECWYTTTVNNIDVGEYQLNGFYYCGSRAVSFPFTFTKVYYTSATGGSTANMNIVRPFNYTNSNISYVVVGMQDVSNASVIVNLEAKGRWK